MCSKPLLTSLYYEPTPLFLHHYFTIILHIFFTLSYIMSKNHDFTIILHPYLPLFLHLPGLQAHTIIFTPADWRICSKPLLTSLYPRDTTTTVTTAILRRHIHPFTEGCVANLFWPLCILAYPFVTPPPLPQPYEDETYYYHYTGLLKDEEEDVQTYSDLMCP